MINSQIHVAIRSYKRAGRVSTLAIVPFAWVWVPESQGAEYRAHYGDHVITIPDEQDGNLGRKQNVIIDRSPCPWLLILDDDITSIGCFDAGRHFWMDPDQIEEMIVQGFMLANDLGLELWGINQCQDPMLYDTYEPFNLLSPILGPFHGHLEPTLRYDESVGGKDDYDFWLQNLRTHRKALRLNKYHYVHNHGSEPGGFVSMRSMAKERADTLRLQEKWGTKTVKSGGQAGAGATGKNILNTLIRHKIPGC